MDRNKLIPKVSSYSLFYEDYKPTIYVSAEDNVFDFFRSKNSGLFRHKLTISGFCRYTEFDTCVHKTTL